MAADLALDARRTANLLGTSGLLPFAALALAIIVLPAVRPEWTQPAAFALAAYGATILSFLGAVHWGLAIAPLATTISRPALLAVSNVPFFVAWGALLLPTRLGLLVLAVGIVAMLVLDRWSVTRGVAPAWWWPVRLRLSAGAGTCLLLGGLFAP